MVADIVIGLLEAVAEPFGYKALDRVRDAYRQHSLRPDDKAKAAIRQHLASVEQVRVMVDAVDRLGPEAIVRDVATIRNDARLLASRLAVQRFICGEIIAELWRDALRDFVDEWNQTPPYGHKPAGGWDSEKTPDDLLAGLHLLRERYGPLRDLLREWAV